LFDRDEESYDLGVHIRLTDMNKFHGNQYGYVTIEDYICHIDKILSENKNIKKIFMASDNLESKQLLKKRYPDLEIFTNDVKFISEKMENQNYIHQQIENLKYNKESYEEVMKDIYSLSKCKKNNI